MGSIYHDAEAALLGAALIYPSHAREVLADLTEEDFGHPAHRVIARAVAALMDAATPPEPVLVAHHLTSHAHPIPPHARITWPGVLAHLMAVATVPAAAPHYRLIVREGHACRVAEALVLALQQALDILTAAPDPPETAVTDAAAVTDTGIPLGIAFMRDRIARTLARLDALTPDPTDGRAAGHGTIAPVRRLVPQGKACHN